MSIKLTELPYPRDSSAVFSVIAHEPWSIFLDSGYPYTDTGRYDILAGRPFTTLMTFDQRTIITDQDGNQTHSTEDPFNLLKNLLGEKRDNFSGLPFCGGALGYFAYDLGRRIEHLPQIAFNDIQVPDMAIGLYDWAVVVDHHQRRSWLVSYGRNQRTVEQWQDLLQLFKSGVNRHPVNFSPLSKVVSNLDSDSYARAFDRIKYYIREGDCYQVNLAQRFMIKVSGSPWDAYLRLRKINPAPFASFFNLPDCAVLSSSPERFLKVTNGLVETKPIKGTRRRSAFAYEDKALAVELLESEKDRAENLMIVDLLRNDLGKNCINGSVSVPKLFALESYATVHHLVSTVTGQIRSDRHALDLFRGCFPGGSITGAPKLRSMEIIEELEPHRRTVYCGSLGYIGFDGNMDCNIAIRTLLYHDGKMYCWAGGGIVVDSVMEAEYQECFDKAAALLHLLETKEIKDVGS
ncbi:MAG: aminodeoxychorismate synthase, component I [Gammaproteobacteria bacterium RIFCSPLOWO2_02_FULL_47_50]|nr:MAG: aminodeoxychorismate synthase, component I [Gammaproteobacteria bacterium RIFCSPLOWO2_02_FULL_47_50]